MIGIARIAGRGKRFDGSFLAVILIMAAVAAVAIGIGEEFDNDGLPLDGKPQASRKAEHVEFKRNVRIAANRLNAAEAVETRRQRSREPRTGP